MDFMNDRTFQLIPFGYGQRVFTKYLTRMGGFKTPRHLQKHIEMLPRIFSIDFPEILMKEIKQCKNNEDIYQVGVEWCISQSKELLQQGVPAIHYYTMGKADNIKAILREVFF